MKYITPENTTKRDFHQFMLGGIVPRPIAWVSTVDREGIRNLAPFSYFNAVSSLPPVLMVSVGRKPDGSKKDTLLNVEQTGELVVNMVPYQMLWQMALTSVQLPSELEEFNLAGLETLDSVHVKPPRVRYSPIQFECRVNRILDLGTGPGESSLIFGDVQCIHVEEGAIDENNRIDPAKLGIVGRMGRSYYTRTGKETLETVVVPQLRIPIGFDALPEKIRKSKWLTANETSQLAALTKLPSKNVIQQTISEFKHQNLSPDDQKIQEKISELIQKGQTEQALILAFGLY
jgi:flavin reductase (DIM6/NTAB) family NADH-FMN oxidoreductase RutF